MNKLILANFKSNKSLSNTNLWFEKFITNMDDMLLEKLEVSVAPSFVSLAFADKQVIESGKNLSISVQDISMFPAGSYTGATSAQNLNGLDIKYSIVGHSERRKYFRETSHDVSLKVEQSLQNKITPVVCVDIEYLDEQLSVISKENLSQCVVAYEPVSAIGSGNNANVGMVKEVVEKIKRLAGDVRILYGGSANESNINEYLLVTDGVLIGTACLDPMQLIKVLREAAV